jgi:hypothetical protein
MLGGSFLYVWTSTPGCTAATPTCLGGSKTILLLKEHHAVQGVLQSEGWGRPCLWGWELAFLSVELMALGQRWLSEKGRRGGRAYAAKVASMVEEERRELGQRLRSVWTPERRGLAAEHGRRGAQARSQAVRITWPDGREEVMASQAEAARVLGCERETVRRALARPSGDLMAPGPGPGGWVPSGVRVQRAT